MALNPSRDYKSQENCDMSNPEEHFLWGLMQIQMGNEMMPMLEATAKTLSKHLHQLGFRHHPKLQKKKYMPAFRGQQNHLNGLARWIPIDAEIPTEPPMPDVKTWTTEERKWVLDEMKRHGMIHEPAPKVESPAGLADWNPAKERAIKRTTSTKELGIDQ